MYEENEIYTAVSADTLPISVHSDGTETENTTDGNRLTADISGNDTLYTDTAPAETVSGNEVLTVSSPDYETVLASMDSKLTAIIVLMLFIWSARQIRNAVRSFTGRRNNND